MAIRYHRKWSFEKFILLIFFFWGFGWTNCSYSQCLNSHSSLAQEKERGQFKPLSLKEAILRNLLQQPAIKVALFNIDIQRGVAQSSGAPFDPVVNSQIFHTYSRDLLNLDQNLNSLNLGQNLNPIAGIPGANPFGQAPVIPTTAQQQAPCSCPSSSSCRNVNANNPNTANTFTCSSAIHTDLQAHETTLHLDVSKKARYGTRILFSVDIDQYHNPIFCPKRLNVGRASVEIDQPLLRGRRYGLDYMTELANLQEVDTIRYDTLQTISQQVFDTISLYWDTLSGRKLLQAQRESEERLIELVEKVKFLIQREQLAPADLMQPLAQLSAQIVSRIQAEQSYYDFQQRLKFAMGEWDETSPCPTDDVLHHPQDPLLQHSERLKHLSSVDQLKGHIEIKNLSFGYGPLDPPLLKNIQLNVTPGSCVALVGPTGSGKSTLIKLIGGLLNPRTGAILFDGTSSLQYPREVLTRSIGMVEQTSYLFTDSVQHNLSLMDPMPNQREMIQAAQDACIHDEIMSRPGGYQSLVEKDGANFSGGQQQRLEIACVLTRHPSILILDEATSAIDSLTERKILENIRRRGGTCLIVTHRLSTVCDCDAIFVMDKGEIVQKGTHEELIQQSGVYHSLYYADESTVEDI